MLDSPFAERAAEIPFVALARQHAMLETELTAAFQRLLTTSAFTLGAEVERFEEEFAAYCGTEHCVGVASGTAALSLSLAARGIGPGDEVIVPAHTYIASALAVAHVGATAVLVDVDSDTGLLSPDATRAAVGPRTAAIVAVHLYGQLCDMDALTAIADRVGLFLLEDCAQAHGAIRSGRRAGSLGDAGAFSFYPSKNLGALGDGGAVCTDDGELAARVRCLRNLGQRAKGEHVAVGWNERLDALQAALLRVKLPHLDGWNAARRAHAARYRDRLPPAARTLPVSPNGDSVYHLFPIRVADREAVTGTLRRLGVQTGVHYAPAVHRHAAWFGWPVRHGPLPHAEAWAAEELSLPMHPGLGEDEIERVSHAVGIALEESSSRQRGHHAETGRGI